MRRHIVRAFAAMAAGGTALLTAGLTATTAAGAATPASHAGVAATGKVIYTNNQAGYKAEGRWFRFVATTVKVPAAGTYTHSAEVSLMGGNVSPVYLAVKAGGGANSVAWSVGVHPSFTGGGVLANVVPKVGDTVLIDLYYNRAAGGVVATATDVTTNVTGTHTIADGTSATFNAAQVACVLANPASPPTGDIRLWQFNKSAVTTNTGVHGTMTGPWTTNTVVDTTNGHATGQTVMSPSALFNGGASFGAWLREWLMKSGS